MLADWTVSYIGATSREQQLMLLLVAVGPGRGHWRRVGQRYEFNNS